MPAVIGAIIFTALFLLLIGQQSNLLESVNHHNAEQVYIQNSASEMAQFYAASLKFMSGFGVAANGQYITVSDLQKAGLLPGAFPALTPFGFQLQGWAVADPADTNNTNLTVIAAAPQTANTSGMDTEIADLKNTGFGSFTPSTIPVGDIQEIDQQVLSLLTRNLLTQYAGQLGSGSQGLITGQTAPAASSANLSIVNGTGAVEMADTGIPASVLPVYQTNSPAIEVIAPNQLGYTVFSYSLFMDSSPLIAFSGVNLSSSGYVNQSSNDIGTNETNGLILNNLGWSATCPINNDIVSANSSTITDSKEEINADTDDSASGLFCLETYRSEKINSAYIYYGTSNNDNDFGGGNFSINSGKGGPSGSFQLYQYNPGYNSNQQFSYGDYNGGEFSFNVNGNEYSNIYDLPEENLNLIDSYVAWDDPFISNGIDYDIPYWQNNLFIANIPALFANIGLNVTVLQPNGSTSTQINTYKILFTSYQIPTGTGYSFPELGLPDPLSPSTGATNIPESWSDKYTVWAGYCMGQVNGTSCVPDVFVGDTTGEDENVFSGNNRNVIVGANGSDVTNYWQIEINPEANTTDTSGAIIDNLPYVYNSSGTQETEDFDATIPASAMCNLNYATGQSGNCPGSATN